MRRCRVLTKSMNIADTYLSSVKVLNGETAKKENQSTSSEILEKQEKNNTEQNKNIKEKTSSESNLSSFISNFDFHKSDEGIVISRCAASGKLRNLELPESILGTKISSIAAGAFANLIDLAKIVIPEGVVSIGDGAFLNCSSLGSITLPSTLKSIGTEAFKGCVSLRNITFNSALEQLGTSAFSECTLLKKVTFAPQSALTFIPALCFFECESLHEIYWPDSLKEICEDAFRGCTGLESMQLPASLTSIGNSAFRGCTRLKSVQFPPTLHCAAEFAFADCSSIEEIAIPESITSLEGGIFSNCSKLRSIKLGSNLQKISVGVFSGCTSLEDLSLPTSLSAIGVRAFCDCSNLKKINLSRCKLPILEQEVFSGCSQLHELHLPFCLKEIYKGCFKGCSNLYSVEIPGEVVSLGERCFEGCRKLNEIDLSSVSISIPEGFCADCTQLTSVRFHNETAEIGTCAFANCRSLTKLDLPDKLQVIKERAFLNCSGLIEVNCGQNLRQLGSEAFKGCNALQRVDLPASLTSFGKEGSIFSNEADELVIYGAPNSCAKEYAKLHRIKFYDPLLHEIKEDGIEDNSVLDSNDITEDNTDEELTPEETEVEDPTQGNKTICRQVFGLRVNPSSYKAITSKGDWIVIRHKAFEKKADARSNVPVAVHLEGINHIGNRAFCNRNVVFLDCSDDLVSIGKAAFWGCNLLQKVRWSSRLSFIDKSAFWGCNSIKNLDFPDSLQFIDNWAFLGCSAIESIHLPSYLVSLGDYVFAYCSSLVNVVIPSGTRSLGVGVFFGCESLRRIVIPPSVKQFGPELCKFSPIFGDGCSLEKVSEPGKETKSKALEHIIIVCQKDSAAHEYALQFGLNYELSNFEEDNTANELVQGGGYILGGLGVVSDSASRCTQAFSVKSINSALKPLVRLVRSEAEKAELSACRWNVLEAESVKDRPAAEIFAILQGAYEITDLAGYIKAWHRASASSLKRMLNSSRLFSSIKDMSPFKGVSLKESELKADEHGKEADPKEILQAACTILDIMEKLGWLRQFSLTTRNKACRLHKVVADVSQKAPQGLAAEESSDIEATVSAAEVEEKTSTVTMDVKAEVEKTEAKSAPQNLSELTVAQPTHILQKMRNSDHDASEEAKFNVLSAVGALRFSAPSVTTKINQELERYYKGAFDLSGIGRKNSQEESLSLPPTVKSVTSDSKEEKIKEEVKRPTLSAPVAELLELQKQKIAAPSSAISDADHDKDHVEEKKPTCEGVVLAKVPGLSVAKVEVPDQLEGRPVETLSDNFMKGNDVVEEICLGPSLKVIGADAFRSCSHLHSVTMAEDGCLRIIKDGAWRSCERLNEIKIPNSVKELGGRVFCACSNLRSVKLPSSLVKLGEAAFADCRSLQSLELPEKLQEVGAKAFFGCRNLESIFIPESLKHLEDKLFDVSQKLTIYASKGSAAESYALAHSIPFCEASASNWQAVAEDKKKALDTVKLEDQQSATVGEAKDESEIIESKDEASSDKKAKYLKRIAARAKNRRR